MYTTFTERTVGASPGQRVDRAAGIIRGVKLLGEHSRNGRRYAPDAMREAWSLYEGVKCYLDHEDDKSQRSTRHVRECVGIFKNAHYREGQGIFADLVLRKASTSYAEMLEIAEDFSSSFGFSHVAEGKSRNVGDVEVIERIDMVYSVDLVTSPATTAGMYESEEPQDTFSDDDPGSSWLHYTLSDPQRASSNSLGGKLAF